MFQSFKFDPLSFIIGLATGLLVWFILTKLRVFYPHVVAFVKVYVKKIQTASTGGAASYIRQSVQRKAQKAHLASTLFSLDEILIAPRFLAEAGDDIEAVSSPGDSYLPRIFPFLPNWPELPSQYNWPSLTAEQILQNGANIAIIGQPGSGKTVALAYLATKFSKRDPALGSLADYAPVFVHIHELELTEKNKSVFEATINLYTAQAPLYVKSRISSYLLAQARAGTAIVLVDGLDQLNASSLSNVTKLIAEDLKHFPGLRFVVAASPDYMDGLLNIGIQPLSLATWNLNERTAFARQWSERWNALIAPQIRKQIPDYDANSLLGMNWIPFDQPYLTPLDWTLKLWAFYSGDSGGPATLNGIDSYISRAAQKIVNLEILAKLALVTLSHQNELITFTQANAFLLERIGSQEVGSAPDPAQAGDNPPQPVSATKKAEKNTPPTARILSQLVSNGILKLVSENAYCFAHPVILAYLASLAFEEDPDNFQFERTTPKEDWLLHYLAAQNKSVLRLESLISKSEAPFYDDLLRICHWLKDCGAGSEWRSHLMHQIVKLISQKDLALGLRPIFFAALTISNDPAVSTLFRQLLSSSDEEIRVFAALGCGALQDTKSIHELALLMEDKSQPVRLAACLALGIIQTPVALQYITHIFSEGDEALRQVAAEALTFWGDAGYQTLKEGYNSENLIQRRAVVFGLCAIKENWAKELLEYIAVQDGQWVVRNSAAQALETYNRPSIYIPDNLPSPADSPWLISFAARQGSVLPPGKIPIETLFSALDIGTQDERMAALIYLRLIPTDEVIRKIYRLAVNEEGSIKSVALLSLWYIKVSGAKISVGTL
jgi:hypothetical protein